MKQLCISRRKILISIWVIFNLIHLFLIVWRRNCTASIHPSETINDLLNQEHTMKVFKQSVTDA